MTDNAYEEIQQLRKMYPFIVAYCLYRGKSETEINDAVTVAHVDRADGDDVYKNGTTYVNMSEIRAVDLTFARILQDIVKGRPFVPVPSL